MALCEVTEGTFERAPAGESIKRAQGRPGSQITVGAYWENEFRIKRETFPGSFADFDRRTKKKRQTQHCEPDAILFASFCAPECGLNDNEANVGQILRCAEMLGIRCVNVTIFILYFSLLCSFP